MEGSASRPSTSSTGNGGGDYQLVVVDQGLRHNFPVIDRVWTNEELDILKDGLKRYESETKSINRYAKIAAMLANKTIRDVAFKYQQMMMDESKKRGNKRPRRNIRKENIRNSSSRSTSEGNTILPIATNNVDRRLPQAIGGPRRQSLELNDQTLRQISANISSNKMEENINLFAYVRESFRGLLNDTRRLEGQSAVTTMPPFPESMLAHLNEAVGKMQGMQLFLSL